LGREDCQGGGEKGVGHEEKKYKAQRMDARIERKKGEAGGYIKKKKRDTMGVDTFTMSRKSILKEKRGGKTQRGRSPSRGKQKR